MRKLQELVKEFHLNFRAKVATKPTIMDRQTQELRVRLIGEEFDEFIEALVKGDYISAVKELGDLNYVVHGTAVSMGFDLDLVTREVHRSNMTKLGSDGKPVLRDDGKALKGPNYKEPDIIGVLDDLHRSSIQ